MPTPKQQALADLAAAGAQVDDNSGARDFHLSAALPPGQVWVCSDTHALSYAYYSDKPAGWRALAADVAQGTRPCDTPDCDTCAEGLDSEA